MSRRRIRLILILTTLAVASWLLVWSWPWANVGDDPLREWLGRVDPEIELTSRDRALAVEVVRSALLSPFDAPADPPAHLPEVFSLRDPREVWVSLYVPGQGMRLGMAREPNLYRSLRAATRAAVLSAGSAQPAPEPEDIAVQIDVLSGRDTLMSTWLPTRYLALEPGVHGIHLIQGDAETWAPPSEPVHRGWLAYTLPSRLEVVDTWLGEVARRLPGRDPGAWKGGDVQVERFTTLAFAQRRAGAPVDPVFRGNVLIKEISAQVIRDALSLGGQWLLKMAKDDGQFHYAYQPAVDESPDDYNVVRHAGTVFGLLTIAGALGDETMEAAALKALPYLRENIQPVEKPAAPGLLVLKGEDSQSSGAAALGLLALSEVPEAHRSAEDAARMEGLGAFLLRNIDEDGRVFTGWRTSSKGGKVDKEPLYYPGEVMLALARLHVITGDARWLEGAERIGRLKVSQYRWIPGGWADHWVMQGVGALAQITGDRAWADILYEMANQSIDVQYPPNVPPWPDYLGMFRYVGAVPRVTRTGSRSEAIRAAMHTAWKLGDDARRFEDSLIVASKATIEQMFRPESVYWVRRPELALGGIRGGPIDDLLRIDFNQHGMVGMLGGLEAALKQEGKPQPGEAEGAR